MKITNEKTTIYLNPKIKKGVQYYALRDDKSLSEIINQKLFEYLEDMADRAALEEARKDGEELVPFERVAKDLGLNLDEIRREAEAKHKKTAQKT